MIIPDHFQKQSAKRLTSGASGTHAAPRGAEYIPELFERAHSWAKIKELSGSPLALVTAWP